MLYLTTGVVAHPRVVSLALILLVLLHSGRGGGLSDMFGGGMGRGGGRLHGGRAQPRPHHRGGGRDLRLHHRHPGHPAAVGVGGPRLKPSAVPCREDGDACRAPASGRAALVVLAAWPCAAACSGTTRSSAGRRRPAAGVLRVGIERPQSLDPAQARSPSELLLAEQLFDGLTTYDPATSAVVPALAASWKPSPDQTPLGLHPPPRRHVRQRPGHHLRRREVQPRAHRPEGPSSPAAAQLDAVAGFKAFNVEGKAEELAGVTTPAPDVVRIVLDQPLAVAARRPRQPHLRDRAPGGGRGAGAGFAEQPVGSGPVHDPEPHRGRHPPGAGAGRERGRCGASTSTCPTPPPPTTPSSTGGSTGPRCPPTGSSRWPSARADRLPALPGAALLRLQPEEPQVRRRPLPAGHRAGHRPRRHRAGDLRGRGPASSTGWSPTACPGTRPTPAATGAATTPTGPGPWWPRPSAAQPRARGRDRLRRHRHPAGGGRGHAGQPAGGRASRRPCGPHPYADYLRFAVSGQQELFRLGWIGAYPTADAFLTPLFHTGLADNVTGFSSAPVDDLLQAGRAEADEAKRTATTSRRRSWSWTRCRSSPSPSSSSTRW